MRRAVVALVVLGLSVAGLMVAVPSADAAGLTNVVAPSVSGTAQVGETLAADPGQWTPVATTFAYHWLRDGQPIANATGPTYGATPHDEGHLLSVEVTAADALGDGGTATSAPTAAVAPGVITARGGQKVVGVARYTHTLTAHPGRYSVPGARVQFQWRRDTKDVVGATGQRYVIRPDDVGSRLKVVMTVTALGYDALQVAETTGEVGYRVDTRRTVTYHVETRGQITTSVAQFRTQAQQTYDDARGWRSAGVRFRPVAHGGSFTLVLAQASLLPSFSSSCSSMWSCRVGRFVIINQDRWKNASPAWNAAHLPLRDYRHMVVNHETGHWLGLHHAHCPGPGRLAPVMQQQSKSLEGCHFNPWPLPSEIASRTPRGRMMVDYGRVWDE